MKVHQGEAVASGVALGRVVLQGFGERTGSPRIASDQVETELNRLRAALEKSREQLVEVKAKHQGELGSNELRIFDTHIAYLQDPMFINAIEKLVMGERLALRASINRVVSDYERILQLAESETLRQRASDFRDVATRLLRNLDEGEPKVEATPRPSGRYVLAARTLSTTDMFNLDNERVEGIVAEEGGITSHAAILARSMGIPTVTGIRDLPGKIRDGDFLIVDGSAGEVRVNPDERVRVEYEASAERFKATLRAPPEEVEHATRDGHRVDLLGSCGSLGEVELAHSFGMQGVGLFRTELMFLAEKTLPTEDMLEHHYRQVVQRPNQAPVNFRLLDVSTRVQVGGEPPRIERNPALGMRGVRRLLQDGSILRLQVRAILRAAHGRDNVGVLVPFVTALSDLQRVKAAILEERISLRKQGVTCAERLLVAPMIEVPAAAFVLGAFLNEADFVVAAVDDLQAYLLAADRDSAEVRDYYQSLHPAVFEVLARIAKETRRRRKNLLLFGEAAADPVRVPFYVGIGIKHFSIAPARLTPVLRTLRRFTLGECSKIAHAVLEAPRAIDVQRVLVQLQGG